MKRKITKGIYWLFTGLIVALFIYSCSEDFYEAKIGDRVTPDKHFNNGIDAEISYLGVSSLLQEIMPNYIIVDGLISDQMEPTKYANREIQDLYEHNFTANNSFINGSAYYKLIITANDVLSHVDQIVESDRNYDTLYNKFLKGALMGYRSWAYFNYSRLFGEARIIPDDMSSLTNLKNLPDKSRDEILDILIEDLLPYIHDNESQVVEIPIMNSINTKALLGEIYLEKGEYQKAADLFKAAMESYGNQPRVYKLDATFARDKYMNIFIDAFANGATVLTAVPFSFEDGQKNPLEDYFGYFADYMIKPSNEVVDAFNNQIQQSGAKGDLYRGLGLSYDTIPGTKEYYISKYSLDKTVLYSADIIVYRAADIHLMLAEALCRTGNLTLANALLGGGISQLKDKPEGYARWTSNFGVRGRVSLKPHEIPGSIEDKKVYLEDLIMNERETELAFEGKRWFDLMRIARRRNYSGYLANRIAEKYNDEATRERVRSKLNNEQNWYFPQ